MSADLQEFAPLLPIGRHVTTLDQLRRLCVEAFPTSHRRAALMAVLEDLAARLAQVGLPMEIWVDGSFLTRKVDPADVDVVVRLQGVEITDQPQGTLQAFGDAMQEASRRGCHLSWFAEYPVTHAEYWTGEYDYCYWMRQWGFGRRQGSRKGIAVISIEAGAP